MAIFRVYENDKPLKSNNYLKWNSHGAIENELVFVSGHPGSTNRLQTMAQFNFNRDYSYPARLKTLKYRISALKKYSSLNPENERRAKGQIFSLENSLKASIGEYDGLKIQLSLQQNRKKKMICVRKLLQIQNSIQNILLHGVMLKLQLVILQKDTTKFFIVRLLAQHLARVV